MKGILKDDYQKKMVIKKTIIKKDGYQKRWLSKKTIIKKDDYKIVCL